VGAESRCIEDRRRAREGTIVLRGDVRSWAEHEDAIHAAWSAPGVINVEDHIAIRAAQRA